MRQSLLDPVLHFVLLLGTDWCWPAFVCRLPPGQVLPRLFLAQSREHPCCGRHLDSSDLLVPADDSMTPKLSVDRLTRIGLLKRGFHGEWTRYDGGGEESREDKKLVADAVVYVNCLLSPGQPRRYSALIIVPDLAGHTTHARRYIRN